MIASFGTAIFVGDCDYDDRHELKLDTAIAMGKETVVMDMIRLVSMQTVMDTIGNHDDDGNGDEMQRNLMMTTTSLITNQFMPMVVITMTRTMLPAADADDVVADDGDDDTDE